jgi:hypothetical protein
MSMEWLCVALAGLAGFVVGGVISGMVVYILFSDPLGEFKVPQSKVKIRQTSGVIGVEEELVPDERKLKGTGDIEGSC